jgi:hypothetical protein
MERAYIRSKNFLLTKKHVIIYGVGVIKINIKEMGCKDVIGTKWVRIGSNFELLQRQE